MSRLNSSDSTASEAPTALKLSGSRRRMASEAAEKESVPGVSSSVAQSSSLAPSRAATAAQP